MAPALTLRAPFTLRVAVPGDGARLTALFAASYPALMAGAYPDTLLSAVLPLMTRANPALLASGTYHIAETAGGEIIGGGGWTPAHPASGEIAPETAHIRHFASHPDWLRQGVGRALFAACAAQAKRAGVRRFEVYSSRNAESFYAAVGFVRVGEEEVEMAPGLLFPTILMVSDL